MNTSGSAHFKLEALQEEALAILVRGTPVHLVPCHSSQPMFPLKNGCLSVARGQTAA